MVEFIDVKVLVVSFRFFVDDCQCRPWWSRFAGVIRADDFVAFQSFWNRFFESESIENRYWSCQFNLKPLIFFICCTNTFCWFYWIEIVKVKSCWCDVNSNFVWIFVFTLINECSEYFGSVDKSSILFKNNKYVSLQLF